MYIYKIADLIVNLQTHGRTLAIQSPPYLSDSTRSVDFSIALSEDFLRQKQQENPHLSMDECEYIFTGADFCRHLLDHDGLVLHASALAYEGRAFLFSAPCGTGKSTHARLWQEYFGTDKVLIINDDKPALRCVDSAFYVYGTPWSGKSDQNLNVKVPLQAICFLEQSSNNWIEKSDSKTSLKLMLSQTLRPYDINLMENLLSLVDKLIRHVPIYKMGCNTGPEAVEMAYQAMLSDKQGDGSFVCST